MLGKKVSLRKYENATVSLMEEFFLDESDHVQESKKREHADEYSACIQAPSRPPIHGFNKREPPEGEEQVQRRQQKNHIPGPRGAQEQTAEVDDRQDGQEPFPFHECLA